jgi:2-polyprenyl-3-methyl-5-hydroxy-6-metoxy-1,4-benzoquinol methylase
MTDGSVPDYSEYFRNRNVSGSSVAGYRLPEYLRGYLPTDSDTAILDIGCGFGQTLDALRREGYRNLAGIDVSAEAVSGARQNGLDVELIEDIGSFCRKAGKRYDFIIMSHVLEHVEKDRIIDTLRIIRENLIAPQGSLAVMVPNAQSPTGCYWRYEDFTHTTIFTAGSLFYVLKSAGFESIEFIDPDGTADNSPPVRLLRKLFLAGYRINLHFRNRITRSAFHRPSPQIFTYEIKAIAR